MFKEIILLYLVFLLWDICAQKYNLTVKPSDILETAKSHAMYLHEMWLEHDTIEHDRIEHDRIEEHDDTSFMNTTATFLFLFISLICLGGGGNARKKRTYQRQHLRSTILL